MRFKPAGADTEAAARLYASAEEECLTSAFGLRRRQLARRFKIVPRRTELALGSPERTYARVASVRAAFCLSLLNSSGAGKNTQNTQKGCKIAESRELTFLPCWRRSYAALDPLNVRKGAARKPSGLWSWPPDSWKQRFTTAAGR